VLDRCAQCGASAELAVGPILFGLASGGVVCTRCRPGMTHVAVLSVNDVEAIRVLASPGNAWRQLDASRGALAPASETVGAIISHVIGHRPRLRHLLGV
jgi:DNA repair protein RecO (recombination protein O)